MSYLDATADLLKVARDTLRDTVAAGLPADRRYDAAMVGRALSIAVRELELGAETRAAERALLGGFYDWPEGTLPQLRARLCRDLRAGAILADRPDELRQLLREVVHARLAISSPDYAEPRR